jgi:3-isopropylmalate dehydrogenase
MTNLDQPGPAARLPVFPRWSDALFPLPCPNRSDARPPLIGVLEGEGIGPEVVRAALHVLSAVERVTGQRFEVHYGGPIGVEAEVCSGAPLSQEVTAFCGEIFAEGGAVLAGPGGGRFVYDLRRRFDLFCKLSPLKVADEVADAGRLKAEYVRGVDVMVVRDNAGGIYQGEWRELDAGEAGRRAEHSFSYDQSQICRLLEVAAQIAARRCGEMSVVVKDGGIPAITQGHLVVMGMPKSASASQGRAA